MAPKWRRRMGALLIIIGLGFALLPLLQVAYGRFSQWQLERQWEEAVRKTDRSRRPKQGRVLRPDFNTNPMTALQQSRYSESPMTARRGRSIVALTSRMSQDRTTVRKSNVKSPPRKAASQTGKKLAVSSSSQPKRKSVARPAAPRRRVARHRPVSPQKMGLVRMEIPRIRMKAIVVDGASNRQLARGPGRFRWSALPGQNGNCAIAGHRNVYGSWFRDLNQLRPGDVIVLRTPKEAFTYRVVRSKIVRSNDLSVLRRTPTPTLTLVTCMVPQAKHRLVVFGRKTDG